MHPKQMPLEALSSEQLRHVIVKAGRELVRRGVGQKITPDAMMHAGDKRFCDRTPNEGDLETE